MLEGVRRRVSWSRPAANLSALLLCMLLAGCLTDLHSRVTEGEANEMLAVLAGQGIEAEKSSPDGKTWVVRVDSAVLPQAVDTLKANGLPRGQHKTIGDIFKKEGLVSTPSEERIRFIYAMSQELSNTIGQIDGVVTARVHMMIPANDPLAERITPASASIFIKHRPQLDIEAITPAIKSLVQRSIEGLNYDHISVSAFAARPEIVLAPSTGVALPLAPWLGGALVLVSAAGGGVLWWSQRRRREGAQASATQALFDASSTS